MRTTAYDVLHYVPGQMFAGAVNVHHQQQRAGQDTTPPGTVDGNSPVDSAVSKDTAKHQHCGSPASGIPQERVHPQLPCAAGRICCHAQGATSAKHPELRCEQGPGLR